MTRFPLTDMDILINDIIFTEVQNASDSDTDIDIYNRVAESCTIADLEHCVKVLELIRKNQFIVKHLRN